MILVSGSLAFDNIMNFNGKFADSIMADKIHMLNVSFLVDELRKSFGGTAGNIAYTLGLLNTPVSILGIAGKDFTTYKEFLKKHNVDTSYITQIHELYTATAFAVTDKTNNQIWGFYPGADNLSEKLSLDKVNDTITFGSIAPQLPQTMLKLATQYTEKKIPYLFDPGMQLPHFSKDDLLQAFEGAQIIIGNDYETAVMQERTGIADLHALAKQDKIIITTLGAQGSRITTKTESHEVPVAAALEIRDPSGAGDAYRGGLLAGLSRKLPLIQSAQMGALAATFAVEQFGTTTHHYTLEQFKTRFYETFKHKLEL
jgi:adenosine kinase